MNIIKVLSKFCKIVVTDVLFRASMYYRRIYLLVTKNTTVMQNSFVSADSELGGNIYIGFNCFITRTRIGSYTSIANNASIGMGEHDLHGISTNSIFYKNAYEKLTEKDCIIGNDVWIGVDVIIRRGIHIGNGAVIGANSFVNTDIPPYAIAVGSPAKIIRYRFPDEKIAIIEATKWWENDDIKKIQEIHEQIL